MTVGENMTGINTIIAEKHWEDETKFLETIQFIALDNDNDGRTYVSLSVDEEGNNDIKLTKRAALWLAEQLKLHSEKLSM